MYAGRTRKVKTDRRGARALAEASLLGAYRRPARRLPDPQRHVGGRLLVRDALVRTRTRYISVIRAVLRQHGYRVPSGSAEYFVHRVQSLPLPGRFEGQAIARRRPPCQGARQPDQDRVALDVARPGRPRRERATSIRASSTRAPHHGDADRRRPAMNGARLDLQAFHAGIARRPDVTIAR